MVVALTIPPIVHRIFIKAPAAQVFAAITTGEGWNAWFTQATTIDLRLGGLVTLRWRDWGPDHDTVEDGGPIVALAPDREFAFLWSRGSKPTTVRFTLEPRSAGTVVTVTDTGHQETQRDLETCISCAAGWGEALALLKFYLEYGVTYGTVPKVDDDNHN